MSGFLLDTNTVSELVRIKPEPRVLEWVRAADEKLLHLSVLTFGEVRKGVTLLPISSKRTQLEHWLGVDLPARFADRLLPINREIAEIWGAMAGQTRLEGTALAIVDGLMAATANYHDLTVVTRNVKDFSMWGVPVTNPWDAT